MVHADLRKLILFAIIFFGGGFPSIFRGEAPSVRVDLRIDDAAVQRESSGAIFSYAEVLRKVHPVVVSVYAERQLDGSDIHGDLNLKQFFEENPTQIQSGVGSGVIVAPQGYVITNNHVIEDAERVVVGLADQRELVADVIGRDKASDIAVLRIHVGWEMESATLGNSDDLEVGDVVFAFGNALGIGHAVTSGIVSAQGRTGIGILGEGGYENFIQTDASMNVGNSGGPLVDSLGRVIGINTAIASPGGGNVGVGFAIPINMARDVMLSLIENGEVQRGYLGVTLRDPERVPVEEYGSRDGRGGGILIVNVDEGSPAERAGLEEGDILVGFNGQAIQNAGELRMRISQLKPGTEVALTVVRHGEDVDLPATLGKLEEAKTELPSWELIPGLRVGELTADSREKMDLNPEVQGLLVTAVTEGFPQASLFPVGSVILEINQKSVNDIETAFSAIVEGRNRFLVLHEGAFHYLIANLSSAEW